jgi:osmotically-inducible protein OsmY
MDDDLWNIGGFQGGFGGGIGARSGDWAMGRRRFRRADQILEDEIITRLSAHAELSPRRIEVHVDHGVVTITGTVLSGRIKDFLGGEVAAVEGVSEVNNRLRVEGSGPAPADLNP